MRIVGELEQMVSEDVPLDHRVHARIIGARGKAIRKIMDEFKVSRLEAQWVRIPLSPGRLAGQKKGEGMAFPSR